jgi:hypothetical protein
MVNGVRGPRLLFAYVGAYEFRPTGSSTRWTEAGANCGPGPSKHDCLSFDCEHLIYTTAETVDPMDGRRCTYRVEFERVASQGR